MQASRTQWSPKPALFFLARLAPELMPRVAYDLKARLCHMLHVQGMAPEDPAVRLFTCIGRHEALLIAPVEKFAPMWRPTRPEIHGLKKLDIQLCYDWEIDSAPFFDAAPGNIETEAIAVVVYVRVHEQITLRYGEEGHRAIGQVLRERLNGAAPAVKGYLFRTWGWPDFVVVALSNDMDALTDLLRRQIWTLPLSQVHNEPLAADVSAGPPDGLDGAHPAFCRTYTVLAYDPLLDEEHGARWDGVTGTMRSTRADVRVRNGAEVEVENAAMRTLAGLAPGEVGQVMQTGTGFTTQIPAALALDLSKIAVPLGHELGHVVLS